MKTKEVKRQEAIARNSQNHLVYEGQADRLKLEGEARADFIRHKIGIPKKR